MKNLTFFTENLYSTLLSKQKMIQMVKHLHVLQEGLLSLYVRQGEISVALLRCHLNCCCHLPYHKLSTGSKINGVYSQNRNNPVLYSIGGTGHKEAVEE